MGTRNNVVNISKEIENYYNTCIRVHGSTPRGVDWNSFRAQTLRFEQIARILPPQKRAIILDYGCGYGALATWLCQRGYRFRYYGYDISTEMLSRAQKLHFNNPRRIFVNKLEEIKFVDFTVASGVFNVKLQNSSSNWLNHVISCLNDINRISRKGFSFNMLTSHSDAALMKNYLFYADPCKIFNHCKKMYSKNVALLHDYDLYEFTVLVKK